MGIMLKGNNILEAHTLQVHTRLPSRIYHYTFRQNITNLDLKVYKNKEIIQNLLNLWINQYVEAVIHDILRCNATSLFSQCFRGDHRFMQYTSVVVPLIVDVMYNLKNPQP